MKFIGQHIFDFLARFRNDVYLEDISTGTIASGGNLGLDSNNKIVKADTEAGELAFNGSTANGVLTYGGASTIDVESSLTFSSNTLSLINSGVMTTTLTSTTASSIDVFGTAYGRLSFTSYDIFGNGTGAIVEVLDAALTATGGPLALKAGGADGTNIAGGNVEIIAGRGTGTGAGGSLRFWSAPAGSSGSSFNTTAEKFSVDSAGTVTTTGAIELGHASDTTVARSASGKVTIEGNEIITTATTEGVVRSVTTTIDQAGMNALHTTEATLVAAPGVGKQVIPLECHLFITRNANNTNSVNLCLSWQGQTALASTSYLYKRFFYNEAANVFYRMTRYASDHGNFSIDNRYLSLKLDGAITTDSVTSMKVYTQYIIIDT